MPKEYATGRKQTSFTYELGTARSRFTLVGAGWSKLTLNSGVSSGCAFTGNQG